LLKCVADAYNSPDSLNRLSQIKWRATHAQQENRVISTDIAEMPIERWRNAAAKAGS
jgi:hypothetical protein